MKIRVDDPDLPRLELECDVKILEQILWELHRFHRRALGATRDRGARSASGRPDRVGDRGEQSRRGRVLQVFRELSEAGVVEPSLREIKSFYLRLFPDDTVHHLDQVVRDLVNKTGRIQRTSRGCYKLGAPR